MFSRSISSMLQDLVEGYVHEGTTMKINHPETFQGNLRKKNYFEGWYYKTVSPPATFAFIPGISLGEDPHAFIQIIDGTAHETNYLRFPLSDFNCRSGDFNITIGNNYFSRSRIMLDLKRDSINLQGELTFSGLVSYPGSAIAPGIMGPFSFIPFMECYHGVVSADHEVNGKLLWNQKKIQIKDGRGYIEKDWGKSMPSSWIWIQSNIFAESGTSFMLSIARIPWLGKSFTGHLGYFYYNNQFYPFATYNGSRFKIAKYDGERLSITLMNKKYTLRAVVKVNEEGGELIAPVNGGMQRPIRERTNATVDILLESSSGRKIYEGSGSFCGIEITGALAELGAE